MVSLKSLTTTWAARLVAAFDASGAPRVGTPGNLASGAGWGCLPWAFLVLGKLLAQEEVFRGEYRRWT